MICSTHTQSSDLEELKKLLLYLHWWILTIQFLCLWLLARETNMDNETSLRHRLDTWQRTEGQERLVTGANIMDCHYHTVALTNYEAALMMCNMYMVVHFITFCQPEYKHDSLLVGNGLLPHWLLQMIIHPQYQSKIRDSERTENKESFFCHLFFGSVWFVLHQDRLTVLNDVSE